MDRQLQQRQNSKARLKLAKQSEVDEAEEPPSSARNGTGSAVSGQKISIPETRVTSFETAGQEEQVAGDIQQVIAADLGVGKHDEHQQQTNKLVRSGAICGDDDTRLRTRTFDRPIGSSKSGSGTSSLSRDSSASSYTDSTGINLEHFIIATLHKNRKDREMLLDLEEKLRKFMHDESQTSLKIQQHSSYNRMLVHRMAAFFGCQHNIDNSGTVVYVCKTENSREPEIPFKNYIRHDNFADRERPKHALKKDTASYEELGFGDVASTGFYASLDSRRARSFECRPFDASEEDFDSHRLQRHHQRHDQQQQQQQFCHHGALLPLSAGHQQFLIQGPLPVARAAHQQHLMRHQSPSIRFKRSAFAQHDSSSSAEILESPLSGYSSADSSQPIHYPQQQQQRMPRPWSSSDSYASSSLDVPPHFHAQHQQQVRAHMGAMLSPCRSASAAASPFQKASSFGGVAAAYRSDKQLEQARMGRRSNTDATNSSEPAAAHGESACSEVCSVCVGGAELAVGQQQLGQPVTGPLLCIIPSADVLPPGAVILDPITREPIRFSDAQKLSAGTAMSAPVQWSPLPANHAAQLPMDAGLSGSMNALALDASLPGEHQRYEPAAPSPQVYAYYVASPPCAVTPQSMPPSQPLLVQQAPAAQHPAAPMAEFFQPVSGPSAAVQQGPSVAYYSANCPSQHGCQSLVATGGALFQQQAQVTPRQLEGTAEAAATADSLEQ